MEMIFIFIFFFSLLIYTIYHFSTAKRFDDYKKVVLLINDAPQVFYCHVDNECLLEGKIKTITYYLKDESTLNEDFYMVAFMAESLIGGSRKLNYYTHFGISRVSDESILKKILLLPPKEGREVVYKMLMDMEELKECPYKIN